MSDLLARLEELGAPDHTEAPWWKLWGESAAHPMPAAARETEPPRRAVEAVEAGDPARGLDEGLQTLARDLEADYNIMHAFWVKHGEQLENACQFPRDVEKDKFLQKMRQLDVHIAHIMVELSKGQEQKAVSLGQVQKATQAIIRDQSIHIIEFQNIRTEFSKYMKALRDVGGILYDHIHGSE